MVNFLWGSDKKRKLKEAGRKIEEYVYKGEYEKAGVLSNFASRTAYELGNLKDALNFATSSAKINMFMGNDFGAGWAYKWAAKVAKDMKRYESAIEYAERAVKLFSRTRSNYAVLFCYKLLAEIYKEMGDVENTVKYYRKCLEMERNEEIEEEMKKLLLLVPNPSVRVVVNMDEIELGDTIDVKVLVKNESSDAIKNVGVLDKNRNALARIKSLPPGATKTFILRFTPKEIGRVELPYYFIEWETKNENRFEKDIERKFINVIPPLEVKMEVGGKLEVGSYSYLTFSIKNMSPYTLKNLKVLPEFSPNIRAKPLSVGAVKTIPPGSRVKLTFKIMPVYKGSLRAWGSIIFEDTKGNNYRKEIETFSLAALGERDIGEREKVSNVILERLKSEGVADLGSMFSPKNIGEDEYIKMVKNLKPVKKIMKFNNVGVKDIALHVSYETRFAAMVSEYDYGSEKVMLMAFESVDGTDDYFLSVGIKKLKDGSTGVMMNLFSQDERTSAEILKMLSKNIENSVLAMNVERESEEIKRRKMEGLMLE